MHRVIPAVVAFLAIALPSIRTASAQSDETIITGSTCQSANLTVRKRNPSDQLLMFQFNGSAGAIPLGIPRANDRTVAAVNHHFGTSASTDLDAIVAVCTATQRYVELIAFLRETSGSSLTISVTPESGGIATLDDGATLTVPPGAVSEPVRVTVRTRGTLEQLDIGGMTVVQLLPEGLQLARSATLTIPYVIAPAVDAAGIDAIIFSVANPQEEIAGEINISTPADILLRDSLNNRISITLDHFSFAGLFFPPRILITPHIPPDRLQKGDLLFTLSDTRWRPGHIGIFESAAVGAPLSQGICIESTPEIPDIQCLLPPVDIFPPFRGVFQRTMDNSFIRPGRIYLGARRPKLTELTPTVRDAIVAFGASQIGDCYLPIGWPVPINQTHWSCAELAVAAYLHAGVTELLPLSTGGLVIFPYTFFQKTDPVTSLVINAGEIIQIPIKVNVVVSAPAPLPDEYAENPPGSTLAMLPSPIATLDPASRTITLAPTTAQACTDYTVSLAASSAQGIGASLDLTVKVDDPSCPPCDLGRLDVANVTTLTDVSAIRQRPTIGPRPGGGWVVAYSEGVTPSSLHRLDVDQDGVVVGSQQLTFTGSGVTDRSPSLSSDGTVLSFQRTTSTTGIPPFLMDSDLLEMSPAGGAPSLVQDGGGSTFFFGPDGNVSGGAVAFGVCLGSGGFVGKAASGSPVDLLQDLGSCADAQFARPRWNSPRSQLTFHDGNQVWVVNPGGGGSVVAVGRDPDWSRDGQHLVYEDGGNIIISTAGGGSRRVVAVGSEPAWSSDGCAIAYVSDFRQVTLIRFR